MGNEMSLYERADEGPNTAGSDSELATELQNGPASLQNSPPIHSMKGNDCVDAKEMVQRDKVTISSQKTIVISPIANGNDHKPPVPAAKSRFRLSVSQPSPGRTTFRAIGPEEGSEVPTEEPLMIQGQKDNKTIVGNKVQNPAPPSAPTDQPPTTSNSTGVEATPSKPKEISLFDRMFKPEKKVQVELPLEIQAEETQVPSVTVEQNAGLQSSVPRSYNLAQDIEDCKQAAAQVQKSESTSIPATPDPKETDTRSEASQTSPPAEEHPVMSFFKTLVSPNKSVPKSEEEPQTEADEKSKKDEQQCDNKVVEVQEVNVKPEKAAPVPILTPDTKSSEPNIQPQIPAQTAKDDAKAATEQTPRAKPFWRKVVEVQLVTVKPEKAAPVQILTPDTKSSELNIQPQIPAQTAKDDAKAATEQTPRAKPFWRKSFKEEPLTSKVQENSSKEEPPTSKLTPNASAEPAAQAAQADMDPKRAAPGTKTQEPQDKAKKPKEEEGKNPKPKLMSFFKQLTLDLSDGPEPSKTEKAVVTAVVEAPAQKSKENPKEKKPAVEPAKQKIIKQESKESPEAASSPQQQAPDPALVQNGADTAKDGQLKRTEKRQSLGSFFKAIGPKRMSDAEVQTDPVSILPAEKVK
ncbi:hypothetical protein FKM82_007638 [Ascaphus truei]